jgi:ABC-type Fe3+ transport system permease subunit
MSAHRTLVDNRQTVYTGGNRRATGSRELPRGASPPLDQSSQQVHVSASAQPTLGDSPPRMENAQSAAGVVAARLLTVLLVVMVVIAILGLTVFDRQGGYSTTAIVSVVIGNSAAFVGVILGFLKAYLACERDRQAAPTAGMH